MTPTAFYPIGTPGTPWGSEDFSQWRAKQQKQRSYADDVLRTIEAQKNQGLVEKYGEVRYANELFPLYALRSKQWNHDLPIALITGGVHGYETSGVHGALRFMQNHAIEYQDRINLIIAPCVSPWAYERIQRWNYEAIDPNRSFKSDGTAAESLALLSYIANIQSMHQSGFCMHIDLHETTDTDESEFRPAKAARDGQAFEPCVIPDGFYLVADTQNLELEFQDAIIQAVAKVTHIAPADHTGGLIGTPMASPGVIGYPVRSLGLCTNASNARYTTTTEVYPDSVSSTIENCIDAQVTAVRAGLDFVLAKSS